VFFSVPGISTASTAGVQQADGRAARGRQRYQGRAQRPRRPAVDGGRPRALESLANCSPIGSSHEGQRTFGGEAQDAVSGGPHSRREVAELHRRPGIMVFEGYAHRDAAPSSPPNTPGWRSIGAWQDRSGVRVTSTHTITAIRAGRDNRARGAQRDARYHGHPEETKAVLTADGGFARAERGYIDKDGFLFITGDQGAVQARERQVRRPPRRSRKTQASPSSQA